MAATIFTAATTVDGPIPGHVAIDGTGKTAADFRVIGIKAGSDCARDYQTTYGGGSNADPAHFLPALRVALDEAVELMITGGSAAECVAAWRAGFVITFVSLTRLSL